MTQHQKNEPVDLKREHHRFSFNDGYEVGRNAGFEGDANNFGCEGIGFYPLDVPTNPGFGNIPVFPPAYRMGYEKGYPEGEAERRELEAKIRRERPDLIRLGGNR